jgi:plastocyanin
MKRLLISLIGLATLGLVAVAVAVAATSPRSATVLIRHETQHCHTWSFNGGAFGASLRGTVAKGGTISFKNTDVMPHTLFQKSGPKAVFLGNRVMGHMSATVKVVFRTAGVYVFATKVGEDYMSGVKTVGEDNVLTLKITVR